MYSSLLSTLIFTCLALNGVQSQQSCLVKEKKTGNLKPCIFPFIYNNKIYNGCTDINDLEGKQWCSTKVDAKGIHVGKGKYWGHCRPDCEDHEENQNGLEKLDEEIITGDGKYLVKKSCCRYDQVLKSSSIKMWRMLIGLP